MSTWHVYTYCVCMYRKGNLSSLSLVLENINILNLHSILKELSMLFVLEDASTTRLARAANQFS